MNVSGPILIIDDDKDDREILSEVFNSLQYRNQIIFFSDGNEALDYLKENTELPFLILSDINMPRMSGLELREEIENNEFLKMKCIPFIFFTTGTTKKAVWDAFNLSVQGFFIKPTSFKDLVAMIKRIVEYWRDCKSPTDYI